MRRTTKGGGQRRHSRFENFGGNVVFEPTDFYTPRDEQEVLEILTRHRGQQIRVVGRRHAWSPAATSNEVLLDLRQLDQVVCNEETALVGAGCQIKRLLTQLRHQAGVTLPSLGLITEQSIAGAISTGTHGSGKHSLSHYVESVRLACYEHDRAVVRTIDSGDELRAARCSLGLMGVILSVRIRHRSRYLVEEFSEHYHTLDEVLAAEDRYPLQQFFLIPWQWEFYAQHRRETDASRSRLAWLYRLYWMLGIDVGLHLLICLVARWLRCDAVAKWFFRHLFPNLVILNWRVVDHAEHQLVMWHELFRHIEIELFVTRDQIHEAVPFIQDILVAFAGDVAAISAHTRELLKSLNLDGELAAVAGSYCHHYPICFRRILPDATLISMASGSPTEEGVAPIKNDFFSISLISYHRRADRDGFCKLAEFLCRSMPSLFNTRPHWGKMCPIDAATAEAVYPNLPRFREICRDFDPDGLFSNEWSRDVLGLTQETHWRKSSESTDHGL